MWKLLTACLLLVAPLTAGAAFYVEDQQYRFPAGDPRCDQQGLCTVREYPAANRRSYSLNFVEINDSGDFHDKTQLPAALEQLERARFGGRQKPVVFIYIHGWHNNAEEISQDRNANCTDHLFKGDVARFRECGLPAVAAMYDPTLAGASPRVVGIYLAWHGNDLNWPGLNIVPSYPIRRHFARKTGETGMAIALKAILEKINEHRRDYFVIAVGHSFGARVLETAAEIVKPKKASGFMHHFRARAQARRANAAASEEPAPADLFFFVNSASSHAVSLQTRKAWRNACASGNPPAGCESRPLYLSISSRADLLTAVVMPIANVAFFAPLSDAWHIIAAANTFFIQTHKVPRKVDNCVRQNDGTFCFTVDVPGVGNENYEVRPKGERPDSPFWALNTDRWIAAPERILHSIPIFRRMVQNHWLIASHGDVWNPGVFSIIRSVIRTEARVKSFR